MEYSSNVYPLITLINENRIFRDSFETVKNWSGNNPIKFVRGAYFNKEPLSKVNQSKIETDETYDSTIRYFLLHRSNSMIIASHNHRSIINAFEVLQNHKIGGNRIICFAQLYGMGDDLTYAMLRARENLPFGSAKVSIVKYIPYGGLHDVLPYLVRRAEENRGMLRGSILEREALWFEVKRRFSSMFQMSFNRD
jgi:proline dehydrogenase